MCHSCAFDTLGVVLRSVRVFVLGTLSDTSVLISALRTYAQVIAIKNAGYTYLYAENASQLVSVYAHEPSRVKVVLINEPQFEACLAVDPSKGWAGCIKTKEYLEGIPIWKFFHFYFWRDGPMVLDKRWMLSPENYHAFDRGVPYSRSDSSMSDDSPSSTSTPLRDASAITGSTQYLGYSVEPSCLSVPFVPHSQRPKNQAYIFSKRFSYFIPGSPFTAWPAELYDAAHALANVNFIAGSEDDHTDAGIRAWWQNAVNQYVEGLKNSDQKWRQDDKEEIQRLSNLTVTIPDRLASSVKNFGLMKPDEFVRKVAESSVLVGVGNPLL